MKLDEDKGHKDVKLTLNFLCLLVIVILASDYVLFLLPGVLVGSRTQKYFSL